MQRAAVCLVVALSSLVCTRVSSAHEGIAGQIATLSVQIARDPANPELLLRRADLYRVARQWQQSLADLDRAVALDPSLPGVDLVRAQVFLGTGNYRRAERAATRFLTCDGSHREGLIVRARSRARLGLTRAAADDLSRALERRPNPDLYIERARLLAASGDVRATARAIDGLDEGIAKLGPIVTLELEAIDLELRVQRFDSALVRLDRLSAKPARQESWVARRGAILERAGRIDEARSAYEKALAAAMRLERSKRQTRASASLIDQLRVDLARLNHQ